ncbi:MAG: CotH kinase family protein [Bacteroidaceae bacterium]|nr:CotH kinase family protein [Bacteroidaceae bacterium]
MSIRNITVGISALLFCCISPMYAELTKEVVFNEYMQSQVFGDFDNLKEIPDSWVELYNPNDTNVCLLGWSIGEKNNPKKCYKLQCIYQDKLDTFFIIGGKDSFYNNRVIYCDNEDTVRRIRARNYDIHTDFRLNPEGGSLYLFNAQGLLSDSINYGPMPTYDVAFGRLNDSTDVWGMEQTPTRGEANGGGFAAGKLAAPIGKNSQLVAGGNKSISLSFSQNPLNAQAQKQGTVEIHYTLDGTEPTIESPLYTYHCATLTKSTIIKSKCFFKFQATEGNTDTVVWLPSNTTVESFIVHPRATTIPVVSVVCSNSYLNSKDYGIFSNNNTSDKSRQVNWRRPAHYIVWMNPAVNPVLNQLGEMRCAGAWSRSSSLKPLALFANSRFDTDDYFYTPFWKQGGSLYNKSILLRNSGNDYGYSFIRDGAAQLSFGPYCDLDWQAFQPAVFYLNGVCKGIINIRERANGNHVWAHYGYENDEIDLIENFQLRNGSMMNFNEFEEFYSQPGHTYSEYNEWIDVSEYLNLFILASFFVHQDFPGNNYVLWRPQHEGGRWRAIVKDVDFAYNLYGSRPYNTDYFNWILRTGAYEFTYESGANEDRATLLFRNMMKDPDIRNEFVDRFTVYLGDFLTSDRAVAVVWDCADKIRSEYNAQGEWNNMAEWVQNRHQYLSSNALRNYFDLGSIRKVSINCDAKNPVDYGITINNIPLATGCFDGNMYSKRTYVIEADYNSEQQYVSGWVVETIGNDGESTTTVVDNPQLQMRFNALYVSGYVITPILSTTGIQIVEEDMFDSELGMPLRTVYISPEGMESDAPFDGVNIVKYIFKDNITKIEKQILKR